MASVDPLPPAVAASAPATSTSLAPQVLVTASDLYGLPNTTTVVLHITSSFGTTLAYATGTLTDRQVQITLPTLPGPATYSLDARLYDRAGNQGQSATITFAVGNQPNFWVVAGSVRPGGPIGGGLVPGGGAGCIPEGGSTRGGAAGGRARGHGARNAPDNN